MRVVLAAILATSMLVSSAFAADNAPLAPGKPAGVKQAQGAAPWIGPALLGAAVLGLGFTPPVTMTTTKLAVVIAERARPMTATTQ